MARFGGGCVNVFWAMWLCVLADFYALGIEIFSIFRLVPLQKERFSVSFNWISDLFLSLMYETSTLGHTISPRNELTPRNRSWINSPHRKSGTYEFWTPPDHKNSCPIHISLVDNQISSMIFTDATPKWSSFSLIFSTSNWFQGPTIWGRLFYPKKKFEYSFGTCSFGTCMWKEFILHAWRVKKERPIEFILP